MYNGSEVIGSGRDGEPEPVQKLQDLVNKYLLLKKFLYEINIFY